MDRLFLCSSKCALSFSAAVAALVSRQQMALLPLHQCAQLRDHVLAGLSPLGGVWSRSQPLGRFEGLCER